MNCSKTIARALDSILAEKKHYPSLEVIVVDGASTDGTVDILRQYDGRITWISEPDSGVAEAFNKGLRLAKGEIIRFFGDDVLAPHTLEPLIAYLEGHPNIDVVGAYSTVFFGQNDGTWKVFPMVQPSGNITLQQMLTWHFRDHFSYVDTWCIRRAVFDDVGLWDSRYRFVCDYDFGIRMMLAKKRMHVVPIIAHRKFLAHDSSAVRSAERVLKESLQVLRRYGGQNAVRSLYGKGPRPVQDRLSRLWAKISPSSYAFARTAVRRMRQKPHRPILVRRSRINEPTT